MSCPIFPFIRPSREDRQKGNLLNSLAVYLPSEVAAKRAVSAGEGSGRNFIVVQLPIQPIDLHLCALGIGHGNQSSVAGPGLIADKHRHRVNVLKVVQSIGLGDILRPAQQIDAGVWSFTRSSFLSEIIWGKLLMPAGMLLRIPLLSIRTAETRGSMPALSAMSPPQLKPATAMRLGSMALK